MRWALIVVLASLTASAEELTVAPGSEITFDAQTTFHNFSGRTTRVAGHLTLDGGHVTKASIAVAAESLQTGEPDRDRNMLGEKYLDSPHHPEILFEGATLDSRPVVRGQAGSGALAGAFVIRGQRKSITVSVVYRWDGDALVVTGETPLDIRDFGMSPPTVAIIQRMDANVMVRFHLVFASVAHP